ncbi:MAG: glycosyltransferase family 2 protein [Haliea sp.]|nr:glycosyltransferase family 2 protein [Haliea sp.]
MNQMESAVISDEESRSQPLTISVIMPVYNGAEFIITSLPPLLAMQQRGEIMEVIVVDDGSTDRSRQIAQDLGAIVISSGGRMGPGGARNQAAAVAQGNYSGLSMRMSWYMPMLPSAFPEDSRTSKSSLSLALMTAILQPKTSSHATKISYTIIIISAPMMRRRHSGLGAEQLGEQLFWLAVASMSSVINIPPLKI